MPEYRKDLLSDHWVIIASDRSGRPSEFISRPVRRQVDHCPFCAGFEQETPAAIAVYPNLSDAASPNGWQVRVIPNKYPAVIDPVTPTGLCPKKGTGPFSLCVPDKETTSSRGPAPFFGQSPPTVAQPAMYEVEPGLGLHEVIIESPQHTASFTELTAEQARLAMVAYRDRLASLKKDRRFRYGLVFKNSGANGGATIEHTHSQLLATTRIPASIEQELRASAEFFATSGRCLFCSMQQHELSFRHRVIAETQRFVAWCPFASRFPYETCIMPRRHAECFETANLEELEELSRLVQRILIGLESRFPHAPYNYWIHNAPFDIPCHDHYHWHIELIPRITTQAGFEWGAGCFVNPIPPEDAAPELRDAIAGTGQSQSNH